MPNPHPAHVTPELAQSRILAVDDEEGNVRVLGQMLRHLVGRRTGAVDAAEPTGLLTHHRVQDGRYDNFLGRFLAIARKHAAACFPPIAEIFQPT